MTELKKYHFVIPGRAKPKERPRFAHGKVFTPQATLEYEARVRKAAASAFEKPLEAGRLSLVAVFYLKGARHADIDNLLKCVMDGCNRVAYLDDKQVKHVEASLVFVDSKEDERVEVTITELAA